MTRSESGRRRTPQQRKRDAQERRAASAAEQPSTQLAEQDSPAGNGKAEIVPAGAGSKPQGRRGLTDEQIAALDTTRWSVQGRLTLALMIAVLNVPLGVLRYAFSSGGVVNVSGYGDIHYSLGFFVAYQLSPNQALIAVPLCTFLGMPLARSLAREPRRLRFLETLGFAAVVFFVLNLFWTGFMPHAAISYTDPKVVAAAALVDAAGLVAGAYLYGPLSSFLSPGRRMRRR